MTIILVIVVGWIFSLCLHEFSHAIVAYAGGDTSVKEKGYLTFNPVKYTHPVFSIAIPLGFLLIGGIGLPGGAVWIDRSRLRSRLWDTAVSLAGPAANLIFGLALSIPFLLDAVPLEEAGEVWTGIGFLILLQFCAVLLNLIPVPPFDGFGAISPWLSEDLRRRAEQGGFIGLIIVLALLWWIPYTAGLFWGVLFGVSDLVGVPRSFISEGFDAITLF